MPPLYDASLAVPGSPAWHGLSPQGGLKYFHAVSQHFSFVLRDLLLICLEPAAPTGSLWYGELPVAAARSPPRIGWVVVVVAVAHRTYGPCFVIGNDGNER